MWKDEKKLLCPVINKNIFGINENILGINKNILEINKNILGINKNVLGINKNSKFRYELEPLLILDRLWLKTSSSKCKEGADLK